MAYSWPPLDGAGGASSQLQGPERCSPRTVRVRSFWVFFALSFKIQSPVPTAGIFRTILRISFQLMVPYPVCQLCYGFFFFFSYTLWGNHFNEIVGWKGNKYLCYSSIWTKEHLFLKCTNNNNNNNSPSPFLYLYPNLPNQNLQRWGLRMQFLKAPWVILRHSQSWEPLC